MKILKLTFAAIFALQPQLSVAGIAKDVKKTTILDQSGKDLSVWWQQMRPALPRAEQKIVDPLIKAFDKYKLPKTVATKISGNGVRIILYDQGESITIDLYENIERMAVVNGIVLSQKDLASFESIFRKLKGKSSPAAGQAVFENSDKWKMIAALFYGLIINESKADDECQLKTGVICWDQVNGDYPQVFRQLKGQIEKKRISAIDISDAANIVSRQYDECVKFNSTDSCQTLLNRKTALLKITELEEKRPTVVEKNIKDEPSFWDNNKSWLKPLTIVAGLSVFVWGLCRSNKVQIFGCGRNDDTDSDTAGLPSVPTSPIYTGEGAE